MRFYIQQNEEGLWHWYLLGENNEALAGSLYPRITKEECHKEIALVKKSADAEVQELQHKW